MSEGRKILTSREASSMVSTWTEHLCISVLAEGTAALEICQYEALAEEQFDEDGELLEVPEVINGMAVVGMNYGFIIGGELKAWSDDDIFPYTLQNVEEALSWAHERGFVDIYSMRKEISNVLSGPIVDVVELNLPTIICDRIDKILLSKSLYPADFNGLMNRKIRYERAREKLVSYYWEHGFLPEQSIDVDGYQFCFG